MQNENIDDLLDQFTKMERETSLSDHEMSLPDYDKSLNKSTSQGSFQFRDFFRKKNLLNIAVLLLGFLIWSFVAVGLLNSKSNRTEQDVFSWKQYIFNVFIIFVSLIVLFMLIQWIRRKYFSV